MEMHDRRDALKYLTAALAGFGVLPGKSGAQENRITAQDRPNIIFILSDNTQHDDLGCTGHPFIKTPGLDKLASEGVIFENAFNTTSLCTPARASILTGQYAHNHGVLNNHTPWKGGLTFLEILKESGYDTGFIGKWHMPGKGLPEMPFLDLFISYTYREGQGSYFDCPLIVNGKDTPSKKSYLTEELTDYAVDFIKKERSQPFCLYLSHRAAHPPFVAPPDIQGMYSDVEFDMPKETDFWFSKTNQNVFQGIMMGSYKQQYLKYLEVLTAMDRQVERFLASIDAAGLRDNTIVIYMGDNGMLWGEHRNHGIKRHWEEAIRLPFIIRAPGLIPDPGGKRSQMVLNIDLASTFLELAGVSSNDKMDGESFLSYLQDPDLPGRDAFLLEYFKYFPENTPSYTGIRTKTHKYIEFEKTLKPQLYDLVNDPNERINLYGTDEGDRLTPELKKLLETLIHK
jgi:arylsulfatase A-like enzyme